MCVFVSFLNKVVRVNWALKFRLHRSYVLVGLTLYPKENLEIIRLIIGCVWSINLSVCARVHGKRTLFFVDSVRSTFVCVHQIHAHIEPIYLQESRKFHFGLPHVHTIYGFPFV